MVGGWRGCRSRERGFGCYVGLGEEAWGSWPFFIFSLSEIWKEKEKERRVAEEGKDVRTLLLLVEVVGKGRFRVPFVLQVGGEMRK